jgi:hypothetical protein
LDEAWTTNGRIATTAPAGATQAMGSVHAFGYLRSTAPGKHYSAVPGCEIRIMDPTDSLDVLFERLSHCIGQQHSKDLRLLASWLKPDTRADP